MKQKEKIIVSTMAIVMILLAVFLVFARGGSKKDDPQGAIDEETIAAESASENNEEQTSNKENKDSSAEKQIRNNIKPTTEEQTTDPVSSIDRTASTQNTDSNGESVKTANTDIVNHNGTNKKSSPSNKNGDTDESWQGFDNEGSSEIILPAESVEPNQIESVDEGKPEKTTPGYKPEKTVVNESDGNKNDEEAAGQDKGSVDKPQESEKNGMPVDIPSQNDEESEIIPESESDGSVELPIILFD